MIFNDDKVNIGTNLPSLLEDVDSSYDKDDDINNNENNKAGPQEYDQFLHLQTTMPSSSC